MEALHIFRLNFSPLASDTCTTYNNNNAIRYGNRNGCSTRFLAIVDALAVPPELGLVGNS